MCKKIIALMLAMLCGQAFAGWTITPYASEGDGTFYWDVQKISYQGDGLTIWTAVDFGKVQISKFKPTHTYLSVQEQLELDCVKSQSRVLNYIEYSDHLGIGSVVGQRQNDAQWTAIEPDTLSYHVMETFCRKPKSNS